MSDAVEERLERHEELLAEQQETIEAQRERLRQLEAANAGPPGVVLDGGNVKVIGEISADDATGVLGKASGNGTTHGVRGEATNGYGLSTPDDAKVDGVAELASLGGGVTGNTPITSLLGNGLTVADGTLALPIVPAETGIVASDGASADNFGGSVALGGDGSTAIVGAEDAGGSDTGKVYVYDLSRNSPTETGITPDDAAGADLFGFSVAISRDRSTAIVGDAFNDAKANNAGKAYVYDLTASPPAETPITASDASSGDEFGYSVGISGDGSTAIVGAQRGGGSDTGKAYVYDLTASPPAETPITASDAASDDGFGFSVGISGDGSTAIVGAWGKNSSTGKAYVYDLTTSPPAETGITASDASSADSFGFSAGISGDGSTAIVGARSKDSAASDAGKAYVYDLTTSPPAETGITASDAASDDNFGFSVGISGDGSTAIVGARSKDSAASGAGKAYVYDLTGGQPAETGITASDAAFGDEFGSSVGISGDGTTVIVGTETKNSVATDAGKVYTYTPDVDLSF